MLRRDDILYTELFITNIIKNNEQMCICCLPIYYCMCLQQLKKRLSLKKVADFFLYTNINQILSFIGDVGKSQREEQSEIECSFP